AGKRTGELEAAEPRADNDDMMPGFVHFVHLVSKIACPACRYFCAMQQQMASARDSSLHVVNAHVVSYREV
ncbi:hypothetical protein, partial [Mesorhizobium sp. M7A.F.Ca.CA.002.07.1.1]|uniref:hypothetical protein n=1 Tax=Mesorhizobium sp. M7A.F.Ca.CA.002.07.1.1 TaxID=2496723 RepID=UPI0019D076B3